VVGYRVGRWDSLAAAAGLGLLALTAGLTLAFARDVGDALTRNPIRLSLAAYFAALGLMLHLGAAGWRGNSWQGWLCRWLWTWGMLACWLHLAAAFHYHDGWSHRAALERTRLASGVGEGIYASYVFSVAWLLDAVWWWLRPVSYARRSPRLAIGLHSFMLLMVFNATVVFESGPIRWLSVAAFLGLAVAWTRQSRAA
jgi:hypothetical protein